MPDKLYEAENVETLKELLKRNSERYSIRNAFLLKDKDGEIFRVTYKKFQRNIDSLGTSLNDMGFNNKKVAVSGKNSYEWCTAYFAVTGGVGVLVPIDKELPFEELNNIIDFAEIDCIIADSKVTDKLLGNYDELKRKITIISTDNRDDERTLKYSDVIKNGEDILDSGNEEYKNAVIDPDELAVLLFTSGTTGMAKGVMLSNRNICSDLMAVCQYVNITYDDLTLSVLPLHHTYETIAYLMFMYKGASVCFCDGLRYLNKNLKEYQPTLFITVPLILEKLHKKIVKQIEDGGKLNPAHAVGKISPILTDNVKKLIFSQVHEAFGGRLRAIMIGAAAMDPAIAESFKNFGFTMIIGYGLTECSPIVMCNNDSSPTCDTIGKPLPGVDAKIINEDENNIGEICVKGPMVMLGYYKAQDLTDEVIKDGYLHTGDLGFIDDVGNYHITGRSKNVIVSKNGKNIYPEELEYYLNSDPMILESMIFGDEDDNGDVTAEIVPDEDEIKKNLQKDKLTREDIQKVIQDVVRKINRILPSYKSIRKVSVRDDEFEKTTTQKIKRYAENSKRKKHPKEKYDEIEHGENEENQNSADNEPEEKKPDNNEQSE